MALSTMDQLVTAMGVAQNIPFGRDANFTANTLAFNNMLDDGTGIWKGIPGVGVDSAFNNSTTLAVSSASGTAGVIPFSNASAGKLLYLARASIQAAVPGMLLIFDRIATWRTLNSGANTITNLKVPDSPDVRNYAGGLGVELWVEALNQPGSSYSITPTYTNSDGVSGRVGPATTVASGVTRRSMFRCGLASGDKGVRSVQSISVTGTAPGNNVLVTLLRSVALLTAATGGSVFDFAAVGLPVIQANAGLSMAFAPSSTGAGQPDCLGSLSIVEG